jgi:hypothetical protein
MKPAEIAKVFSQYIDEGTTPKSKKVQSFFNNLPPKQMGIVAKYVAKSYDVYMKEEQERAAMRKEQKKEISALKKKAKELGFTLAEM